MPKLEYNTRAYAVIEGFLRQGRIPHSFLIEGAEGAGKKTMAAHLAKTILCTGTQKPCGVCSACVKIEKQIHPDVSLVSAPAGKKLFPVDTVREVREHAYISPNESDYKIYIFEKAHTMNNEAQNALLKLLEDPPPAVKLILLCENRSMMLPTILSRVITLTLQLPTVEQCAAILQRLMPEHDSGLCNAAAAGAGGNVGRALASLDDAKPSKSAADARILRRALAEGSRFECLRIFAGYEKDREGLLQTLNLLTESFSRLAVSAYRGGDEEEAALLPRMRPDRAIQAAQAVAEAIERVRRNVSIALLCADLTEKIISTG